MSKSKIERDGQQLIRQARKSQNYSHGKWRGDHCKVTNKAGEHVTIPGRELGTGLAVKIIKQMKEIGLLILS